MATLNRWQQKLQDALAETEALFRANLGMLTTAQSAAASRAFVEGIAALQPLIIDAQQKHDGSFTSVDLPAELLTGLVELVKLVNGALVFASTVGEVEMCEVTATVQLQTLLGDLWENFHWPSEARRVAASCLFDYAEGITAAKVLARQRILQLTEKNLGLALNATDMLRLRQNPAA